MIDNKDIKIDSYFVGIWKYIKIIYLPTGESISGSTDLSFNKLRDELMERLEERIKCQSQKKEQNL